MTSSASANLLSGLETDPVVFAHQYNPVQDQALLIRIDPARRAEASFLDERILTPQTQGAWFAFGAAEKAAASLKTKPQGYIFHAGHCGSTLVSRLIAEASGSVAVREPLPLRAFAADKAEGASALLNKAEASRRLDLFERLWAREDRPVIVKATSMCADLIDDVCNGARRVFIYQKPETHLAVLLAGANAEIDLKGFAQLRHRRASRHFEIGPLSEMGLGALAALTWLSEASAAARATSEISSFDFDDFLADPPAALMSVSAALGFNLAPNDADKAVNGPLMKTYSKAPEHPYDASLRRKIIAQAKKERAAEIKSGMQWLEGLAGRHDEVAALLRKFG